MSEQIQTEINDQNKSNFKNTILKNKKSFLFSAFILLLLLFAYFFYVDQQKNVKVKISEKYNLALITYDINYPNDSIKAMKDIVSIKDSTYSPLALYFLLDNNLLENKTEINQYFDILINDTGLDTEIKNLIIYKKGLYNSATANEEELLKIFKPLINNENLWRSHSLYVIAEYFFSKNEMKKSKEFFEKILEIDGSNPRIKLEAQKRLRRDFSV